MPNDDLPQAEPENRVNEDQTMIGNRDGKFMDRLVPALLAAGLGVAGTALVFWSDTRANDRETATAISRLNKEVEDIKRTAEADRQKQNELAADVKVILAIMQRIERAVDARPTPPR